MKTSDFDYHLPDNSSPAIRCGTGWQPSAACGWISAGVIADRLFAELPDFFRAGDLLVFNDTRVIKARLRG
jgi:S-adenosylmethionine:tRNA ribosyltransferase-isomerase